MPITPTIHLGVATQAGPLTVFPVWTDAPAPKRALRTALPKSASVGEVDEHSVVERLQLHHTGKSAFLLPGATVFGGGWQHRALVHGVLVEGPVDLDLDVRCVEAGRWHGDAGAGQGVHSGGHPSRFGERCGASAETLVETSVEAGKTATSTRIVRAGPTRVTCGTGSVATNRLARRSRSRSSR